MNASKASTQPAPRQTLGRRTCRPVSCCDLYPPGANAHDGSWQADSQGRSGGPGPRPCSVRTFTFTAVKRKRALAQSTVWVNLENTEHGGHMQEAT